MSRIHRSTGSICRPLLLALCVLLTPEGPLRAQEYLDTAGRWKTLRDTTLSGFLYDMEVTDIEAVTPLFFSDTLHGVLGTKRGIVYQTDDGGRSWQGSKAFVPVPHTRFADGSAISPGGYYRLGGADTLWRKLSVGTDQAIGAASFDGTTIASLYPQESVTRLAISTDRGTTWRTLDTTRSGSGGFLELSPLTRFGPIPTPAGKITYDYSWREIYTFPDSRTLVVRAVTRYDSADNIYEHDYIGRLDPTTMTARWLEPPDRLESIRFISSSEAYGFTMNPEKFPSTRIHIGLWWSTDGGARWDSVGELPVWIDTKELRSLTFLSRNHGVSINAVTHDGGRSWSRWSSPFAGFQEYAPRLAVVDSAHYFIFGIYSHFARSTDAGHTWSRTLGGSFPHAAAAYRGSVVVGRDFQTLLFSADSGESWQDLAPLGRVPRELQTVWSLAWPDSVHEPERVIGIASFMPYDARQRVSFIESSDGGRSWREGARIPQFDSAIALAERAKEFGLQDITGFYYAGQPPVILRFVDKSDHSGTVGFACSVSALLQSDDAGRTWRLLCDTIRFGNIAMADAMHGVAYGLPSVSKPAALYRTDDGGLSWSWTKTLSTPYHYGVGLTAFDSNNYRLLTPDQNSDAEAWNIVWSEDGGRTWRDREYVGQNASWTMDAFWLDSTDLHIIDGFGDVRHSTNAGNTWHMLHPAIAKFGRYRVGAIISEANLTASDGSYYYFASARNLLGRWRIARRVSLPTSADDPFASASGGAGDPIVAPNPVSGGDATVSFELARGSTVAISICDLLGEQRVTLASRLLAAGAHAIPIDLSGLEPGAYFVRMVRSGVVSSFPFVIAR